MLYVANAPIEEGHARFTRHSLGQQCFASTWMQQQHAIMQYILPVVPVNSAARQHSQSEKCRAKGSAQDS